MMKKGIGVFVLIATAIIGAAAARTALVAVIIEAEAAALTAIVIAIMATIGVIAIIAEAIE